MIRGIGVDMVYIPRIARFRKEGQDAFFLHTFSEAERKYCEKQYDSAEHYASRFAVKESVFKALNPLGVQLDLRKIETRNREDGSPYVVIDEGLQEILRKADVDVLHVSITNEEDYAVAYAIAEKL